MAADEEAPKDNVTPEDSPEKTSTTTTKRHKRTSSLGKIVVNPKELLGVGPSKATTNASTVINLDIEDAKDPEVAINLDDAFKHYGHGKSRLPVLLGLNMEVGKGQIYGLLGPSGCGKTTLLKCIVGKLALDKGMIHVFGETPGPHAKSGVPGARVGYMPQELALFDEFSISETLVYFARLYGMSHAKFKERLDFLMKFLDLPSKTRALHNMSGGQQRRASLAVALLHEPELLILDEPTVGVDPLLRTSIWSHLIDLASASSTGKATTIVITTHYIEEARQADRVGMMRFGKLLAEGSPDRLLETYNKPNLEDVFLELCLQDGDLETTRVREQRRSRSPIFKAIKNRNKKQANDDNLEQKTNDDPLLAKTEQANGVQIVSNGSAKQKSRKRQNSSNNNRRSSSVANLDPPPNLGWTKVRACMLKTFNRMKKRVGFLIYQFVLPALQVSLFCLAIGQDPKDLSIAVVNGENNGAPCVFNETTHQCPLSFDGPFGTPEANMYMDNFTCRFLSYLDSTIATPVYFDNMTNAIQSVQDGHTWGVVSMNEDFSHKLYERIFDSSCGSDLNAVDPDVFAASSIKISMDVTNQHIAFTLQLKLVEAFDRFMKQMIGSCGLPTELASIPLVFEEPIYGNHELTFTDFMAPGIILTIVHSMALGYSAMIIIMERNEGLLDRTWVAGVTPGEFALAHFLVSLVVNLLQVIVTLVFMILVFQVPAEGSIVWIFLLTMLQGICGTTIGLIISAVCKTQQDATQIALGIFYPNLILSGIIWPIESMPAALRYIAYILPQTFACEAMRGILLRGWGITYMPVWRGYLVTLTWIFATYAIFKKLVMKES